MLMMLEQWLFWKHHFFEEGFGVRDHSAHPVVPKGFEKRVRHSVRSITWLGLAGGNSFILKEEGKIEQV